MLLLLLLLGIARPARDKIPNEHSSPRRYCHFFLANLPLTIGVFVSRKQDRSKLELENVEVQTFDHF